MRCSGLASSPFGTASTAKLQFRSTASLMTKQTNPEESKWCQKDGAPTRAPAILHLDWLQRTCSAQVQIQPWHRPSWTSSLKEPLPSCKPLPSCSAVTILPQRWSRHGSLRDTGDITPMKIIGGSAVRNAIERKTQTPISIEIAQAAFLIIICCFPLAFTGRIPDPVTNITWTSCRQNEDREDSQCHCPADSKKSVPVSKKSKQQTGDEDPMFALAWGMTKLVHYEPK